MRPRTGSPVWGLSFWKALPMKKALPPLVLVLCLGSTLALAEPITTRPRSAPAAASASPAEAALNRGYAAMNKGEFLEAQRHFDEAAKADPRSPLPVLGMADIARMQRKEAEAVKLVQRAYELAPASQEALTAMGRLSSATRKFDDAERYFTQAEKAAPSALVPKLDLGEFYLNVRRKPEIAEPAFRAATAIKPDHAGAWFGLGMSLLALNRSTDAVDALANAVRLEPKNPLAHFGMGQAEAARRNMPAALRSFEQAYTLDPKYAQALAAAADVKQAAGDTAGAIVLMDRAVATGNGGTDIRLRQGMLYHAAGDADKAFQAYSAVIAAQPSGALAYNNAAALAAERKIRLDDALVWARKATALAPEESAFVGTLGMVHAARGEKAEAINALERAATLKSPRADALFLLGELREGEGRKDAAAEAYRKALAIDPTFAKAGDAKARLDRLKRTS